MTRHTTLFLAGYLVTDGDVWRRVSGDMLETLLTAKLVQPCSGECHDRLPVFHPHPLASWAAIDALLQEKH